MTIEYDTTKPVMVTGGTGYVAGWLIKYLLEEGVTVHTTVRNPDDHEKLSYLNQIAEQSPGQIKYFKADLLNPDNFAEPMEGCQVLFHTASPFSLSVKDPQRDLIDPALKGTRHVMQQASKTASVQKVVLTSSCAAIYSDNIDLHIKGKEILTEEDWNEGSSVHHQPYFYSKTVAEKEAWNIAGQQDQYKLVVINPGVVIGKGINPFATSETFTQFKKLGRGDMKMGVPHLEFAAVDVRDVAQAHIAAAFQPKAHGRYIISGHNTSLLELSDIMRKHFGNTYPFPKREVPKWLVWLTGPIIDKSLTRQYVRKNIGWPLKVDNRKSIEELGMQYRPLDESVVELFQQLIDSGQVPKC